MQRKVLFVLMLCTVGVPWPLSSNGMGTFYSRISDSIVYIKHEIYLDSSFCKDEELFQHFEDIAGIELLNRYLPIKTGSGFFIDTDGIILTNRHVLRLPNLNILVQTLIKNFDLHISQNYFGSFNQTDITKLSADFRRMILNSNLEFNVVVKNMTFNSVKIIDAGDSESLDLALLKISSIKKFDALPLAEAEEIDPDIIGNKVFSFGYPLGAKLDKMFEKRVVTMNNGTISAYREDSLNIQHSAAVSPGNSGGPLVDEKCRVIGINSASLQEQEGANLFYSIGADRIRTYLTERGFDNLLKWNDRIELCETQNDAEILNEEGDVVTSNDLLIDMKEGAEVLLNGKLVGTAPLLVEITDSLNNLVIRTESNVYSTKLRLSDTTTGITRLSFPLQHPKYPLFITSEQENVEVWADGRKLGVTPLNILLSKDTYSFSFYKDGWFFNSRTYQVSEMNENHIRVEGESAYPVTIEGLPLPPDISKEDYILSEVDSIQNHGFLVKVHSGKKESVLPGDKEIWLPEGKWNLQVVGLPNYEEVEIISDIFPRSNLIDLNDHLPMADLSIKNLPSDAFLWVDGNLWTEPLKSPVNLPVGLRDILIWKDGCQPLETRVTVRPDNTAYIKWQNKLGHDIRSRRFRIAGGFFGFTGVTMLGYGIYSDNNNNVKRLNLLGSGSLIAGAVLGIAALIEWKKYINDLEKINLMEESK